LALAVFFALYVQFFVDPHLIHVVQSRFTTLLTPFWSDFVALFWAPGRWLEITSQTLEHLHYFGWPGAILLGGALLVTLVALRAWVQGTCGRAAGSWLAPAFLLILLHSRYDYTLGRTLRLALAIAMAALWTLLPALPAKWQRQPVAKPVPRLGAFHLVGPVLDYVASFLVRQPLAWALPIAKALLAALVATALYWVAGGACVVFLGYVAVTELFGRRRPVTALLIAMIGVASVFACEQWVCIVTTNTAIERLSPVPFQLAASGSPKGWTDVLSMWAANVGAALGLPPKWKLDVLLSWVLILSGPVYVMVVSLIGRFPKLASWTRRPHGKTPPPLPATPRRAAPWLAVLQMAVFCAAAGAIGYSLYDASARRCLHVDYLAGEERWEDVLKEARTIGVGEYSPIVSADVTLALLHTGRLTEEMFRYPQIYPLLTLIPNDRVLARVSDLYLQAGCANAAEAVAGLLHHSPLVRRVAWARMVKGRISAGRACLDALVDDPFEGPWARRRLAQLDADPNLDKDPEVRLLRTMAMKEDRLLMIYGDDSLGRTEIANALRDNPKNHAAFELLLAMDLRSRNLDTIPAMLSGLGAASYDHIPRHMEEAMLVYARLAGKMPGGSGWSVRPQTAERWKAFQRLVGDPPSGDAEVRRAAKELFGDTYFCYFYYGS
jgi:hypothetical protein